jgi:glycerol kinase
MLFGALDNGTTSSRFIVFDLNGSIISSHQEEYESIYPQPGWCEQDPIVLLNNCKRCMEEAVKRLPSRYKVSDIKSIGITNQRETTVAWNGKTGSPLCNAIVWLDSRTSDLVHKLSNKTPSKSKDYFRNVCGLPLSTYFSALKLKWMFENVPAVKHACDAGELKVGTVDSWLIWNLTGKEVHVTDVTNASRTMLLDLKTLKWSNEMCAFFEIPKAILPQIRSSAEIYGNVKDGLLASVPISGCLGDQQAALVGQRCFKKGQAKNTYGTGCFLLFNTGDSPVVSNHGMLTTVGYQLGFKEKPCYALEGSIAIAGAAVKWLRDNLGLIKESSEISTLAESVQNTAGVHFVPAFNGLFAPYWRDDARGIITGLTQYTTKAHIARAVLEAVSFQTREIVEAMSKDSGITLKSLRVDGGMTVSDILLKIQAEILGIDVLRPEMRETTAFGAAFAAAIGIGAVTLENEDMQPATVEFKPRTDEKGKATA